MSISGTMPPQLPFGADHADADLDTFLARYDAPVPPDGLVPRIVGAAPLHPQIGAAPRVERSSSATIVPLLRVVPSASSMPGAAPARSTALWRGVWPMAGGAAIGAVAAGLAVFALVGSPDSPPDMATGRATRTFADARVAVTPAPLRLAATTSAGPAIAPGAAPSMQPVPAQASTPREAAPADAAPLDATDADATVTPVDPDRARLAAQSPELRPGPVVPAGAAFGPELGAASGAMPGSAGQGGAMGPTLPQGYGFSAAIGGGGGLPGAAGLNRDGMAGMPHGEMPGRLPGH
jgi:hypothetical protein